MDTRYLQDMDGLSYLSVSGIVITAAGIMGFALILYWAVKRIRWNAQY